MLIYVSALPLCVLLEMTVLGLCDRSSVECLQSVRDGRAASGQKVQIMLMEAMGSSAEAQRLSLEPHPVFGFCLGQCSSWCSERLNFVCAATCGWGDSMVTGAFAQATGAFAQLFLDGDTLASFRRPGRHTLLRPDTVCVVILRGLFVGLAAGGPLTGHYFTWTF